MWPDYLNKFIKIQMEIKTSLALSFDTEPTEFPPEDYSKGEVIFLTEKP